MTVAVVQSNHAVERLTGPVARFARAHGIELRDIDLTRDTVFPPEGFGDDLLFFGSVAFLRLGLAHPCVAPHLAWSEDAFRARNWAGWFDLDYVGIIGFEMTAWHVGGLLRDTDRLAVRPAIGMKEFQGGVYTAETWDKIERRINGLCFATAPTRMLSEYRVWFVSGRAVAASRYREEDASAVDLVGIDGAMREAERICLGKLILPNVVVDIAETEDGWKIIELNCIHTAGWYAADPDLVLDALIR